MKIAIIDTTIDEDLIGGAHTFLPKLLKGLTAKGHEVHLITKGLPNEKVQMQIKESGALLHTNLWDVNYFVEESAPQLARWLNNLRPDIYLISASSNIGWVVLPLLNPIIATLTIGHTDSETFYLPVRHYHSFLTRAIGVSPEICQTYISNCMMAKARVDWIPYGVQASQLEPREASMNILKMIYVGRLEEEQKRVSSLVQIVKLLSKKNFDFNLQVIGDGNEGLRMKEHLREEIESGDVVMQGWIEGEEVLEAMRSSEVFVLTSAYEGFCIALAESMANGCCPVVTDVRSGNGVLVENDLNGFVVEVGDVEGFAAKLIFLSKNRDRLLEMRKRSWQLGMRYDIKKMIENYEFCFQQACDDVYRMPREICRHYPLMKTCESRFPIWLRRLKRMAVG